VHAHICDILILLETIKRKAKLFFWRYDAVYLEITWFFNQLLQSEI